MSYIIKRNNYYLEVSKLKFTNWKSIALLSALTLGLAACNTDEVKEETLAEEVTAHEHDHKEEAGHHEETVHHDEDGHHTASNLRFVVSTADGVKVLDEKYIEIKDFAIGQHAFTVTDDGRYVFARDAANKDSYTLIDSGLYVEDHGDHDHPYAEEPAIATTERAADKPAHMISHAGRTAIFNDGSGEVDVYTNEVLATENLKPDYTYQGIAHHGAAVPLSNGFLATTFVAKEGDALPTGVKIVDQEGKEQAVITDSCVGLHGTAYGGEEASEKLAFGCMGKVAVYDVATNKTTDIVLPDEGARVGTVKHVGGSDYFFTNYSVENEAQTKVGVINSKTGELKLVELPSAYKSATLVTADDIAYVLAEDGNLYAIELKTAKISLTISAFNPFNLDEEAPALFEANHHVFILMPSYQKLYEVHGNHTHEVAKFDYEPTTIVAIEAY